MRRVILDPPIAGGTGCATKGCPNMASALVRLGGVGIHVCNRHRSPVVVMFQNAERERVNRQEVTA